MRPGAAVALLGAAVALAGCVRITAYPGGQLTPYETIYRAAARAPAGAPGVFRLRVRAVGADEGAIYLNSELDYRDQRNLTVAIPPRVARALSARIGGSLEPYFRGRLIEVLGVARRERILFVEDSGAPSGKYYYQTHVRLTDPADIRVLGR